MASKYKSPIERADEAIAAMTGEKDEPTQPETDESTEIEQNQGEPEPIQKAEQESVQEPPQQEDENSQTYKQRFAALQGLFNGEKRKVEQLKSEFSALQHQMHKLQQQKPTDNTLTADATSSDIAAHLGSLATEFGDDFTKALQSVVRGEVSAMFDQRMRPVEERVNQVAQNSEEAQRDSFNRNLEGLAPGWQQTYNDPIFQQWLDNTRDEYANRSFRDYFDEANQSWDAQRIAKFFNKYLEATGKQTSIKDDAPKQDDPRKRLVTPGKSNAGNPAPPQQQAKVWSIAEVNKYYSDFRQGAYRGREAEADQIEAEIDRANAEGRIR